MRNVICVSCSKDFLRITDGMSKILGLYCGNQTGQNLLVTEDNVEIIFHTDGDIERRGYLLNFTLVSNGKCIRKPMNFEEYTKFISHLNNFHLFISTKKIEKN